MVSSCSGANAVVVPMSSTLSNTTRASDMRLLRGTLLYLSAICFNGSAYAVCHSYDGEFVAVIIKDIQLSDHCRLIEGIAYEFTGSKVCIKGSLSAASTEKFCDYSFNYLCKMSTIRQCEGYGILPLKPLGLTAMRDFGFGIGESYLRGDLASISSVYFDLVGVVVDNYKHGWMLLQLLQQPSLSNGACSDRCVTLENLVLPHQCSMLITQRYCFVSINYYSGYVGSKTEYSNPKVLRPLSCADIQVGDQVSVRRVLPVMLWGEVYGFATTVRSVVEHTCSMDNKSRSNPKSNVNNVNNGGRGASGFKMVIPRQFYTGNHMYVVWWALSYVTIKRCLRLATDSSSVPDQEKATRKLIHAILEKIVNLVAFAAATEEQPTDAIVDIAAVPWLFRVKKEHRSEISEFFQPHFASLFSVRSGEDADYLSQALPQCYSPKAVIDRVTHYAARPKNDSGRDSKGCRFTTLTMAELSMEFTASAPRQSTPDNTARCLHFIVGSVQEVVSLVHCEESYQYSLLVTLGDRDGHSLLCVMQFNGSTLGHSPVAQTVRQMVSTTVDGMVSASRNCFVILQDVMVGIEAVTSGSKFASANVKVPHMSGVSTTRAHLICDLRHVTIVSVVEMEGSVSIKCAKVAEEFWNRSYPMKLDTGRRHRDHTSFASSSSCSSALRPVTAASFKNCSYVFGTLSVRDVLMLPESTTGLPMVIPEIIGCVANKLEQIDASYCSRRQVRIVLSQLTISTNSASYVQEGFVDEISLYLDVDRPVVGDNATLLPDCIAIGMTVLVKNCCLHLASSKKFVYLAPPKDLATARGFSISFVGFATIDLWCKLYREIASETRRRSIYNQCTAVPSTPGEKNGDMKEHSAPSCSISSLVDSRASNRCIWTVLARISYIRSVSLLLRCETCRSSQVSATSVKEMNMQYTNDHGGSSDSTNDVGSTYQEYYRYANRAFSEPEFRQATTRRYGLDLSIETSQRTQCFCRKCNSYSPVKICWECTVVVDDGSGEAHMIIDSKEAILLLLGFQRLSSESATSASLRYVSALPAEKYEYMIELLEQEAWQCGSVNYDAYKVFSDTATGSAIAKEFVVDDVPVSGAASAVAAAGSTKTSGNKRQRSSEAHCLRTHVISKPCALLHSYILEYFANHQRDTEVGHTYRDDIAKSCRGCAKIFKFITRIITTQKTAATQQRALRLQRVNTHNPFSVDHIDHQTLCTHQLLLQAIFMSAWDQCSDEHSSSVSEVTSLVFGNHHVSSMAWNLLNSLQI